MPQRPSGDAEPSRPRVAVFGAGSVGCQLGGLLAEFADVTLIGRPAAMDTLGREGLTLTGGPRGTTRLAPGALRTATTPEAAAGADYVLVTVKSADTADAARSLAPHLGPATTVVSFQNGLRNAAVLRSGLEEGTPVLAGMVPYNVVRTGPGAFHQGSAGALMFAADARGDRLARALDAAGLPVRQHPDMPGVLHAKLLMNLNNAVNALSGLPLREQLGTRAYRLCLALGQREALAAYRAEGIRSARLTPLGPAATLRVLRLPDALFRRVAASTLRIDAQARSSTWEDLQRGRPTEIDTLQGEIVAMARRHGLAAPVNERLIALVREAEAAGAGGARRWPGDALLAELTAVRTN